MSEKIKNIARVIMDSDGYCLVDDYDYYVEAYIRRKESEPVVGTKDEYGREEILYRGGEVDEVEILFYEGFDPEELCLELEKYNINAYY